MSNSGSTGSINDFGLLGDSLQIPNYHFTAAPISHGDNVDIVFGYRISNKKPVIAKISPSSLRLEREYYIMKRLYQSNEGSSFLVRPLEYIHLQSGITVVIYADEGQNYLEANTDDVHQKPYGPIFDLCTFLRFAIKCTDCLEFIHRNNVVHGEVRLSAFQWGGDDSSRVKMWNFGSGTKSLETYLTSEGWRKTANNQESMNKLQNLLAYMSPEQTGRTTYVPDHRSDIYSLGIVFFVLLTGKAPFTGGPLEILNGILSKKVPLVNEFQLDIPNVIARIIEKMTHKSPDDRYCSAFGIRADLKECLQRLSLASSVEAIEPFKLAEKDVASVFTLPKAIYGRQTTIVELTYIIQRVASTYKSINRPKLTSTVSTQEILTDQISDRLSTNGSASAMERSNATPSYYSGFDGSDISSVNNKVFTTKQGVEIVAIFGPGGVGKSTVFNAVQNVARQHGYVAYTKFDSKHKVPYSCVIKALSQILQQVLSESEDEIHAFYDHLKSHLGAQFCNIRLLADLVPELKPLMEPCTVEQKETLEEIQLDNVEARIRFHNLFIEVFRAISQWRLVSLFLDDIHLADDPSIELVDSMVASRIDLLIFLAYRDQEITKVAENFLSNNQANFHAIHLDVLDFNSLVDYISDALHRPLDVNRDAILPLAELVHTKTRGNAFYTAQLLLTLEKKKLIFFNWEENEWDYSLSDIQHAIMTNNERDAELDIDFLVSRLKELPLDGQRLLKWASFVGDTFSWNTVKYLMLHSDAESECSDTESISDTTNTSEDSRASLARPYFTNTPSTSSATSSSANTKSPFRFKSASGQVRDPINGLQAALQEGYILPLASDEFKWSHDRYSQAAMELANPKTREKIHLQIARYLLHDDADCLLISDHLLKCMNLLFELDEKSCFRDVLYEAGNKARVSGAHKMAYKYYQASIMLLDPDPWKNDYTRTLYLYSYTVSLSWTVGDYDTTEAYLDLIFANTSDPMDRITAYKVQYKYRFSRQMHLEGSQALYDCLRELDVEDFKVNCSDQDIQHEYDFVLGKIKELGGVEKIANLPMCEDAKTKAIMSIMEELCTSAYWSANQPGMCYAAIKLTYYSMVHGLTIVSGIGLIFFGLAAVSRFKNYVLGEELGAVGLKISDKTHNEKARACLLYAVFLLLWKHHYRDTFPIYRAGLRSGIACGDRIYSTFTHIHIGTSMLATGENLADVLVEAENCYEDIHAWSASSDANVLVMCTIRTVKALQGHTYNSTPEGIFDGDDGFNDSHFIAESVKQSSAPDIPLNWYESYRMLPLVLYGHYEYAIALGNKTHRTLPLHPNHRHTRLMVTMHALAVLEKLRVERDTMDKEEFDMYLEMVETNLELLRPYVEFSRVNYIFWESLIKAEKSALLSNDLGQTIALYESAIDQAREAKYHLDLCICHEYAGGFYARAGMKNLAYGMLKKAIKLYMNHGSYGKAHHVTEKYSALLAEYDDSRVESFDNGIQTDPIIFGGPEGSWKSSSIEPIHAANEPLVSEIIPPVSTEQTLLTLDILDMASILKSSQVISSEVKFDGLIKSMMTIILENSGADCGAIIVKEEKYGVCAYGSQFNGSMVFDPPRPLSENDDLVSSRIIHHTINTGESIFIHNVERDSRFAVGPWYERVGGKSIICMPITHKSALAGCLFLEGASGIFTQRHITVMSLLCQQMGISITNAFLFKSIQRVTMTNMRMIEMQKKALEEARKSKEAAVRASRLREIFLANMSHEIRTPFSGFYGMISLLAETALDPEQRDLVMTAKESCEILLQIIDDLLNFSKLQAGKVTLDLSPVVVEDLIADVVEMLIPMAIQKNINVAYTLAENVPYVVMLDGNRLRQVLVNLLGNAIKFTHEGEIRIQCSLDAKQKVKDPNEQVVLLFEVIDTGIGISEEQRKVLFEPFSQVDGSTTRKYGGTGLGLSICLQLVKLMSGSIDVSSVPGKGSDFYFNIRCLRLRPQNSISLQTDGYFDERTKLLRCLSNIRVLAISKHAATLDMIRFILPGIHVDGVNRIEDFMNLVFKNKYDVIIVGLYMNPDNIGAIKTCEWLEEASRLNKDGLIIIMNYPMNGKSGLIEHVPSQKLSCKTIRMAVPLRRIKLLRTIGEILNKKLPSSAANNIRANSVKLITDEERASFSKLNILIAEDNPVAQKLLLKQLTRLGFNVECANNGLEAINAWINHPDGYFTMAFFDHHMPKCDGVAATKRIREIQKVDKRVYDFPIVALTADVQDSAREICMNAGMTSYLTKPLNQKILAETLRTYCCPPSPDKSMKLLGTSPPLMIQPGSAPPTPPICNVTESLAVSDKDYLDSKQ